MTDLQLTSKAPPPLPPRSLLVCRRVSCWHNSHFMTRHWARPYLSLFLSYSWSLESGFRQTLQIAATDMHWFHSTASCNLYPVAAFIFDVNPKPTLTAFSRVRMPCWCSYFSNDELRRFLAETFSLIGESLNFSAPILFSWLLDGPGVWFKSFPVAAVIWLFFFGRSLAVKHSPLLPSHGSKLSLICCRHLGRI